MVCSKCEMNRGKWVVEIPDAYKDIDAVMADAADAADVVDIEHTLRQVLNVKGT